MGNAIRHGITKINIYSDVVAAMNGGLKEAIAVAVEKADLGEEYRIEEKVDVPTGLAAYMSAFSARVKASWEASELGVAMKEYRYLQEAMSQTGVVMYSPVKVEF